MDPRRRFLLFRLVLYAVLGGIVAAVLLTRPHGGDGWPELHAVRGRTAAGEMLVLKLDDDGVLRSWDTTLRGRCSDGSSDGIRWHPGDTGAPARVTHRDGAVDAVEVRTNVEPGVGEWTVRVVLHADVRDGRAAGTFRYRKTFEDGHVCAGEPVGFAVPLDRAS